MDLITIVLTLAVVGFILWLIVTYIPMPQPFKTVIMALAALFLVLWLLQGFGFGHINLGRH